MRNSFSMLARKHINDDAERGEAQIIAILLRFGRHHLTLAQLSAVFLADARRLFRQSIMLARQGLAAGRLGRARSRFIRRIDRHLQAAILLF